MHVSEKSPLSSLVDPAAVGEGIGRGVLGEECVCVGGGGGEVRVGGLHLGRQHALKFIDPPTAHRHCIRQITVGTYSTLINFLLIY